MSSNLALAPISQQRLRQQLPEPWHFQMQALLHPRTPDTCSSVNSLFRLCIVPTRTALSYLQSPTSCAVLNIGLRGCNCANKAMKSDGSIGSGRPRRFLRRGKVRGNEPANYIFVIVLTIRFWQRFRGTPGRMAPWLNGHAHVCVAMTHTGGSVSVILQGPCGFSRH